MNPDEYSNNSFKQKVKLIFNPKAGAARKAKIELHDVLYEMQKLGIQADTCVLGPECNLALELKTALCEGIRTVAVCGGDGTISSVADILAGTDADIAVIPAGTQNNNAKSLNIPLDMHDAVALIRAGHAVKIDAGIVQCCGTVSHFLEIVSVGLTSALMESGDAVQHGNIAGIGEFLSTLVACPPSKIKITLDGKMQVEDTGFIALVTNMPYAVFHYQFGHDRCNRDGLLNVLFFSDLSKIDLLKYISQGIYLGKPEDPRIQHFLARTIDIETEPPMPVTADGRKLGEGKVHIELRKEALGFIVKQDQEPL